MDEDITQMQERHRREILQLQSTCRHPASKRTGWTDEWWGLGHSTGHSVQSCLRCGKVVGRMCCGCGKKISKWRRGLAYERACKPTELPNGSVVHTVTDANDVTMYFCQGCFKKRYRGKKKVQWTTEEDE